MRNKKIIAYYTPKMVLTENIALSTSKSPLKPMLVMKELMRVAGSNVRIQPKFKKFDKDDFMLAHTKTWVDTVFHYNKPGAMLASSIPWSEQLVETLRYTSSSLYHAIKHSIEKPDDVCFSSTSGFHHARPTSGSGFCTFAGQVVASVKIYEETGNSGCYLDLDGHFGNSIEDCRDFQPLLNLAVPRGFNFNPSGRGEDYVNHLETYLYGKLKNAIISGEINYVVWCHGADSHNDDDLGGQVNTNQWVACSEIFWNWVKDMDKLLGRSLPISFALFGGYRKDSYESVISLHISDIVAGLNILTDANIDYTLDYKKPSRPTYEYHNRWSERKNTKTWSTWEK